MVSPGYPLYLRKKRLWVSGKFGGIGKAFLLGAASIPGAHCHCDLRNFEYMNAEYMNSEIRSLLRRK